MKLLAAELAKHGATLAEGKGTFQVITRTGTTYGGIANPVDSMALAGSDFEKLPDTGRAVLQSVTALVGLEATVAGILADNRLSDIGRSEKLVDPRNRAIQTVLGAHQMVAKNSENLDRMEAQRYAAPPYDKTDLAGELRAREARDLIRAASPNEREAFLQQLRTGEDGDLIRAILRSPISLGNIERVATSGWRDRIDREDPDGRAFLDLGRRSNDWANRVLLQTQAFMKPLHGFTPPQLFERLGKSGASFFGISAESALAYEREMMARNAG